jgi:hypothetical protein
MGNELRDGTGLIAKRTRRVSDSVTRPANTTQYAANDALSGGSPAALNFVEAGRSLGKAPRVYVGTIRHALVTVSSYVATAPDLMLYLFSADTTPAADNVAVDFTDAELANLVGKIAFATGNFLPGLPTAGAGGNQFCSIELELPFTTAENDPDLYGALVMQNAYVPVASEEYNVYLDIE